MNPSEVAALWQANAETWTRHVRLGYDVYRATPQYARAGQSRSRARQPQAPWPLQCITPRNALQGPTASRY